MIDGESSLGGLTFRSSCATSLPRVAQPNARISDNPIGSWVLRIIFRVIVVWCYAYDRFLDAANDVVLTTGGFGSVLPSVQDGVDELFCLSA